MRDGELSWYWVPVQVAAVVGAALAAAIWLDMRRPPRQSWRDRGAELAWIFWRSLDWREWMIWVLAMAIGVPIGVARLISGAWVHGAVVLAACVPITYVGLKALDARIELRHRRRPR